MSNGPVEQTDVYSDSSSSYLRLIKAYKKDAEAALKSASWFIEKNPALHKAVKEKDWANIASNYNGPSYKEFSYDTKLEAAYNEYKKKGVL